MRRTFQVEKASTASSPVVAVSDSDASERPLNKLSAESWEAPDTHRASARLAKRNTVAASETAARPAGADLLKSWSDKQQTAESNKAHSAADAAAWMASTFHVDDSAVAVTPQSESFDARVASVAAHLKAPDTHRAVARIAGNELAVHTETQVPASG